MKICLALLMVLNLVESNQIMKKTNSSAVQMASDGSKDKIDPVTAQSCVTLAQTVAKQISDCNAGCNTTPSATYPDPCQCQFLAIQMQCVVSNCWGQPCVQIQFLESDYNLLRSPTADSQDEATEDAQDSEDEMDTSSLIKVTGQLHAHASAEVDPSIADSCMQISVQMSTRVTECYTQCASAPTTLYPDPCQCQSLAITMQCVVATCWGQPCVQQQFLETTTAVIHVAEEEPENEELLEIADAESEERIAKCVDLSQVLAKKVSGCYSSPKCTPSTAHHDPCSCQTLADENKCHLAKCWGKPCVVEHQPAL